MCGFFLILCGVVGWLDWSLIQLFDNSIFTFFSGTVLLRNSLTSNQIGAAGAASLADALKQNSTVHTIE